MAFYDSVKEDIRDETGASTDDEDEENMPFDQLKDEAEEREDPDDAASSSDTDIEVLGDGDLADTEDTGAAEAESRPTDGAADPAPTGSSDRSMPADAEREPEPAAMEEAVQVLQRIEQQNQEMLDVLRGIKRSLE